MFKSIFAILDRLFIVAAAILFSQLPLYMQQYQQQLNGHVNELRLQLNNLKKIATQTGKSLEQYIDKFRTTGDIDFLNQAEFIEGIQHRYNNLSSSLFQLEGASVLSKPFLFVQNLDWSIAKATLASFKPGLLFTLEGVCYVLVGMVAGYLFFRLLLFPFTLIRYRKKRNQN